ncbi:hypothetical protein D9757_015496 [Collybiopsis confluens]|uniref:Uncharacterized protein n=1 Tax=Collybiopsis confluens TaxID=2823264 RepID=A0A8H5CLL6_9AGAR|nr:hypothetical protein D9757_015496 [Collybiopsis confluens]
MASLAQLGPSLNDLLDCWNALRDYFEGTTRIDACENVLQAKYPDWRVKDEELRITFEDIMQQEPDDNNSDIIRLIDQRINQFSANLLLNIEQYDNDSDDSLISPPPSTQISSDSDSPVSAAGTFRVIARKLALSSQEFGVSPADILPSSPTQPSPFSVVHSNPIQSSASSSASKLPESYEQQIIRYRQEQDRIWVNTFMFMWAEGSVPYPPKDAADREYRKLLTKQYFAAALTAIVEGSEVPEVPELVKDSFKALAISSVALQKIDESTPSASQNIDESARAPSTVVSCPSASQPVVPLPKPRTKSALKVPSSAAKASLSTAKAPLFAARAPSFAVPSQSSSSPSLTKRSFKDYKAQLQERRDKAPLPPSAPAPTTTEKQAQASSPPSLPAPLPPTVDPLSSAVPHSALPHPPRVIATVIDENSRLRSYKGRVGSVFDSAGLLVTSPNMDVIHAPIHLCETRMRRNFSFGKDDPLWWPQPFYFPVGHLAVIPLPTETPLYHLRFAWYSPRPDRDFLPVSGSSLMGTGNILSIVVKDISGMCQELLQQIPILCPEHRRDPVITQTKAQIRRYLERLPMRGTCDEMFHLLSCTQRSFLELYSRIQWLTEWVPRHSEDMELSYEADPSIIGAFTDNLDAAATLYKVGIPVWVVRPKSALERIKVLQLVGALDKNANHHLPIRGSLKPLDVSDASPRHSVIYTGLSGQITRYVRMSGFLSQRFNHSVLGLATDANAVEYIAPPVQRAGQSLLYQAASHSRQFAGRLSFHRFYSPDVGTLKGS